MGFIQKLPTQLVAAFRATLEEIGDASLLLHLVDCSHPNAAAQADAVTAVLDSLEVDHIPILTVWNKARPPCAACPSAKAPDTFFRLCEGESAHHSRAELSRVQWSQNRVGAMLTCSDVPNCVDPPRQAVVSTPMFSVWRSLQTWC